VLQVFEYLIAEHLIDTARRVYCPYKDCSVLLERPEPDEEMLDAAGNQEAPFECPCCKRQFCLSCGITGWHVVSAVGGWAHALLDYSRRHAVSDPAANFATFFVQRQFCSACDMRDKLPACCSSYSRKNAAITPAAIFAALPYTFPVWRLEDTADRFSSAPLGVSAPVT
jgi:hypothetical protein